MSFVFPPGDVLSAPVIGTADRFPIARIYCLGRNYAAHAREMGADERDPPFFFAKDADAYAPDGAVLPYPSQSADYQHEIELVVAIGKSGSDLDTVRAMDVVFGYAVGLDMTRRDLQLAARKSGRPWTTGKNFPLSAPMGPIHRLQDVGEITSGAISLKINGEVRQSSDLSAMIWSVREAISYISRFYELQPGDLVFTGTPEGVGAVVPGDELVGSIDRLGSVTVRVGDAVKR